MLPPPNKIINNSYWSNWLRAISLYNILIEKAFITEQKSTVWKLMIVRLFTEVRCVSKNIPDVFSYNSGKHCPIFIVVLFAFGKKKVM